MERTDTGSRARGHLVVREAVAADAAALIELWAACAAAAGDEGSEAFTQQSLWREPSIAEATEAIALNLAVDTRRIWVAELDDVIVGATVCDLSTLTPITMSKVLVVTDIQVDPRQRRRSIAATLLSTVSDYGESHGCELVVAVIPAHSREPHRYLTKLGFNQIAVVRAIASSKLRSRLTSKATSSRDTGRLIAVRRALRKRSS